MTSKSAPSARGTKYVYSFGGGTAEGDGSQKNLLGGKGANLAEMARIGLPVPPGFTITTEVCTHFYANGRTYPKGLEKEVDDAPRAASRRRSARSSATRRTRSSSPSARAPAPRCPG